MKICAIVAVATNGGIGKDNQLLWHQPADLRFFKETTSGFPIIMGRKTFESIGRPLPKRKNIVITRQKDWNVEGVVVVNSLEAAIDVAKEDKPEKVFITGGAEIYKQSLPLLDELYFTEVNTNPEADTFFPIWNKNEWVLHWQQHMIPDEKNPLEMTFQRWLRKG
jgi:dihydrofolate reductase